MASAYTPLGVQLMVTGEKAGLWGGYTNTNLEILEQIAGGYTTQAVADGTTTALTVADGATGATIATSTIKMTGALTGSSGLSVPDDITGMKYLVLNSTTGGQTVTFKTAGGTGVSWATTDARLLWHDGTNIVDSGFGQGLAAVVDDTTPQLGGDLDVNGNDIVSTSNADISIIPNGSGDVNLGADAVQLGDLNADATLTTQGTGDMILNTNNGTNAGNITLADGANGNISFTNNGTGVVQFNDAAYFPEGTLVFDVTQDWDVQASPVAKVTLTNNVTFDAPSNPTTGQFVSILCIQDGVGSRTIAWNAVFEFAADTAPTATTTGDKGDLFSFRYNGAKWLSVGTTLDLTLS